MIAARGFKRCSVCKQMKPLADFGQNTREVDGKNYHCLLCARERQRKWYAANKAKIRAWTKRYYDEHQAERQRKSREWYHTNKDYARRRHRKWIEANPERIKLSRILWHKANPEYTKLDNKLRCHQQALLKKHYRSSLANCYVRTVIANHSNFAQKNVPTELTALMRQYLLNKRAIRLLELNKSDQLPCLVTQVLVQEMVESARGVYGYDNGRV